MNMNRKKMFITDATILAQWLTIVIH